MTVMNVVSTHQGKGVLFLTPEMLSACDESGDKRLEPNVDIPGGTGIVCPAGVTVIPAAAIRARSSGVLEGASSQISTC
jgi:hypothetical protein